MNTEKKELSDNELIAEFMGGQYHKLNDGFIDKELWWFAPGNHPNPHCNAGTYKRSDELEYHIRWDWLMPVVEKIERLSDVKVTINKSRCRIVAGKKVFSCHTIVKINSMYRVVVEFLRWLNSKPKS